jgi:hypothetical protein
MAVTSRAVKSHFDTTMNLTQSEVKSPSCRENPSYSDVEARHNIASRHIAVFCETVPQDG